MQATLARIDAANPTLNAFVALRERDALLADAAAADARIASGEARPLEGIPLGVKDLEDAAGLVTSEGSVPFKDNLAERDSVQVARLRAAGAIVVGKTNAPEFGYTAITKNLLFGVTRNPWNLERTPGRLERRLLGRDRGRPDPARHRQRRRRLGAPARLDDGLLRPEGAATGGSRTKPRRSGSWTTPRCTARSRAASRTPRSTSTSRWARTRSIPTRCPHPGFSYRALLDQLPAGCASAGRRTSATPWCSATSARSPTTRRASSRSWACASTS